ncbi:hypothetical protein ACOSQ3_020867 [Xanthoceras sorbifolium]
MLEILLENLHLYDEHLFQHILLHLEPSFQLLGDVADIQNQFLPYFKMSNILHMSSYQIEITGLHRCLWMRIKKLKMVIISIHLMMMDSVVTHHY